ncbi:hypothetical protein KORDIASMS9_03590 [Kordia sp. SMS9]|nr:hypothetical protein KORDIASMS9_03590 [Kordia sp. SMS9]
MNKRKIYFFTALALTLGSLLLLVTGSSILTTALDSTNSVPLGTFITWIGLFSLPMTLFLGAREMRKPSRRIYKILSVILKTITVLAILWVPISYLLAGNISFTFTEKEEFQGGQEAMRLFWRFTYGIVIGTIGTLLAYWISLIVKKK